MPHVDHVVQLAHFPSANPGPRRDARAVGDLRARAGLAVELPRVEGASDRFALNATAFGEVSADVRAVGVEHPRISLAGAEEHHLVVEVADALNVADAEVLAPRDGVPAVRETGGASILVVHLEILFV